MTTGDPPTPTTLAVFAPDARALPAPAFAAKHGDAFFLHYGPLQDFRTPEQTRTRRTQVITARGDGSEPRAQIQEFLVFPVRVTGRSPFPDFISVGRERNNDVVVADPSLSKFHAYLRRDPGGAYRIQDAGSTNGTLVNDLEAPTRGKGEPLLLQPGMVVVFGRIRLTFVQARELQQMAARLV